MRITIVHSLFPIRSETFIVRHVIGLDAELACDTIDRELLSTLNIKANIYSLAPKAADSPQRMWLHRASKLKKVMVRNWNKLFNPVGNTRWDRDTEKNWIRYLNNRKPDVVLAEFAPNAFRVLPACRQRNIPVVVHFHGFDASRHMRFLNYRRSLPYLFRECRSVVCVSNAMRDVLLKAGCPAAKLHLIPCGAPVEEFVPSGQIGAQPCRFIVVSRLSPGKGPMVTLQAFHETLKRLPGVRLTFVGDGELKDELVAYCRTHGLESAVEFTGAVGVGEVRRHMAQAQTFLQASQTTSDGWVEGCSVSLSEALATGLPAIVSRSGGNPDLVQDGVNGLLFEEGDFRTMAKHMVELATDPAMRVKMGMAGRKHVEDVCSTEANIGRLKSVLLAAMEKE